MGVVNREPLRRGFLLDGKWRIDELLGEGGVGAVYGASHARNSARVAVKVLHADVAREHGARERFLQEGYAANRVGHAGVVRVLDDGTSEEGLVYLVMERLTGASLEAVAERAGGQLPLDQVLKYTLAWLEVIAAAHAAGIVHRDLKPENVFICDDGSLRVLDFGLAKMREAVSQMRLTTTGVPLGTPAFMPREQALANWDEVDARSDVYSLGASVFALVTGHLVHEARSVPEMIVKVCTTDAMPLARAAPHVPAAIGRVIDRALASRRDDRFANAGTMLAALRAAMASPIDAGSRVTLASESSADSGAFDDTVAMRRRSEVGVAAAGPTGGPIGPDRFALARNAALRTTDMPVSSGTSGQRLRTGALATLLGVGAIVGVGTAIYFLTRPTPTTRSGSDLADARPTAPMSSSSQPGAEPPAIVPAPSAPPSVGPPSVAPSTDLSAAVSSSVRPAPSPTVPKVGPGASPKPPPPKPCYRDKFKDTCPCPVCVD